MTTGKNNATSNALMPALPPLMGSQSTGDCLYNSTGDRGNDNDNTSQNLYDNNIDPFGREYDFIAQDYEFNECIHHYRPGIPITNQVH